MTTIVASRFERCRICGCLKAEILQRHRGRANGVYFLNKFCRRLADVRGIHLRQYCERYLGLRWPRCPVTGEEVGCRLTGHGVVLCTYRRWVRVMAAMSAGGWRRQRGAHDNSAEGAATRCSGGFPEYGIDRCGCQLYKQGLSGCLGEHRELECPTSPSISSRRSSPNNSPGSVWGFHSICIKMLLAA